LVKRPLLEWKAAGGRTALDGSKPDQVEKVIPRRSLGIKFLRGLTVRQASPHWEAASRDAPKLINAVCRLPLPAGLSSKHAHVDALRISQYYKAKVSHVSVSHSLDIFRRD